MITLKRLMKFTTKKQKNCSVIFMSNDFSTVIKTAKTVTLIGSRKPPERIANIAVKIGRALNERGIRAYSGALLVWIVTFCLTIVRITGV
ncbi:hypothetical protein ALHIDCOG_00066 [Klebsiella phage CPRSB]|nr:hypothetical protein ALHIDCOG_00066 [Klebsiella phage CPRSB]